MVYDRKKEQFAGWLDISMESDKKNLKEPEYFFPVILDMKNSSLQDLFGYFYQNSERKLYVLEQENECISLLMIPNILKFMPSVVPLSGVNNAETFFRESMCRLPEIIRVKDKALADEVKNSLCREQERRVRENRGNNFHPLLTIGIPSWNRGKRAKELVEELCKLPFDVDLEILVSNNGSDKGKEEYHAIRDIKDSRVTYIEFEENKMYYGNIAQALRKSSGNWIMLLSDEDFIDEKQLQHYMTKLEMLRENVSVIRPGSLLQYHHNEDYRKAGEAAIAVYSLDNNYVSGATYNRKFMTNTLVDKIEKTWIDNYAYKVYAHMIFDWYMCLKGDFYQYAPVLVLEGKSENSGSHGNSICEYNQFKNRIRQFNGYLDIINGMDEATEREKITFFMTTCMKTIFLLCAIREQYEKEPGGWEMCRSKTFEEIKTGWENLNVSSDAHLQYKGDVRQNILNAVNKYKF